MASTQPKPYTGDVAQAKPKKKKRIFMWFFLAVQVLFIVWIIAGANSANGNPSDCSGLDVKTCNDASDAGTAIGVALIIVLWAIVDIILGVTWAVVKLARR